MEKFMVGKKAGMTQLFDANGASIPVTVIDCGPVVVVQKKTLPTDGYNAVKIGYTEVPERKLNKPDAGQFKKAGVTPHRILKEFRTEQEPAYELGQELRVSDMFAVGDHVDVHGVSKGKGYAGAIKRHNYSIGPRSHGSKYHRGLGSMGPNTYPGRVFKGKGMPGHMGAERVTVQNLGVVMVDGERNILAVKGAIPGPRGGVVEITTSVKATR